MYQQHCLHTYALAERRLAERAERARRLEARGGAAHIRLAVRRRVRAQRSH